jgi:predicted alpha/beta hydrolase family esterase
MQFVIFHGSLGYKDGNWFPDLKKKLEDMGQEVFCPQYPVDDYKKLTRNKKTKQNLNSWMTTFEKEVLPYLSPNKKICFVGHSLGNLFILHVLSKYKTKLDCAIFVSPCLDKLGLIPWQYDLVNTSFYKTDFDFEELVKLVPTSYVLYSDNDPYIEPRRALHFARVMESSTIFIKHAGHLNAEVNLNEFPLVFDLCITRIDLGLYQRYVLGRTKDSIAQNIINATRKYIRITPEEGTDEGRFHFMNISRTGFATFVSNSEEWNPEDEYFTNGRKASMRGVDFSRVFVIKNIRDLDRKALQRQIALDIEAGIKVRFITYEIYKTFEAEEDFGIWDDEYTCTIHRNKQGKVLFLILDSRMESIKKAQVWREKILKKSVRIRSFAQAIRWKKEYSKGNQ